MLRYFVSFVLIAFSTLAASAQERPSAILVLDASGSMWGQIEGVNKIVIARDVVTDLLQTLPEEQQLGLVAYGHRTKGDCGDIEVLADPGADRADIATAVQGISPKGKTPLSAAVIEAAETLKYTEEAATVILVSDGIETCDFDPCEVGRRLEETGVNFTAHVIGFDVADAETRAQLQCLAEETGGTYRSADNADELAGALTEVAAAPPAPEPVLRNVTFLATDGENGPMITDGLIWTINAGEAVLATGLQDPDPNFEIEVGTEGSLTVLRLKDEESVDAAFTVTDNTGEIRVALPKYAPPATVSAPASAPAGSMVAVTFTGPREKDDYLASAKDGSNDRQYDEYTYVADAEGDSLMLRMPAQPGPAEIRYVLNDGREVLGRTTIEVTPLDITLTPPEGASVGQSPDITWTGPDYKGDYLTVSRLDDDRGYETYTYTEEGSPLALQMPTEPGTYELRYVLSASRAIAARSKPFEVSPAQVSVAGPAEAVAGTNIPVTWTGPNAKGDYITITKAGERTGYETYTYTKDGNPLDIRTPVTPGNYEIRYILSQDRTVLASQPLVVTDVAASLTVPATATGGEAIDVTWTGPDYDGDYITVAEVGSPDGQYRTYTYTREGSPLSLEMPTDTGTFEVRYVVGSERAVIGKTTIDIKAASATLTAPDSVMVGTPIDINWSGPDSRGDYLTVAEVGSDDGRYIAYAYTKDGNPARIKMPTQPGTYELRYFQAGFPDTVLTTRSIEIADAEATVSGEVRDDSIAITWTGPGHTRDYVTIAHPDSADNAYIDYEYVDRGQTVDVKRPETPGTYELRYILDGNETRAIAKSPIIVE